MNSEFRLKVSDVVQIALVVVGLFSAVAGWSLVEQYSDGKQIAAINQHLESIDRSLERIESHYTQSK